MHRRIIGDPVLQFLDATDVEAVYWHRIGETPYGSCRGDAPEPGSVVLSAMIQWA